MFNVAYVVITVKARLEGMDSHIEEAAMDLGANSGPPSARSRCPRSRRAWRLLASWRSCCRWTTS